MIRYYGDLYRDYAALEAERDALREKCEKLEWLAEVYEFYIKCNVPMRALVEVANTLESALAECEEVGRG